ncbi:MAG: hypothetical protein HKN76_13620 [Saprospiraceae bacterium]|nr:hypothetical protein [Saprospiraceae bacterium]
MTEISRLVYVYQRRAYKLMTNLKTIFLFLLFFTLHKVYAQVSPPVFQCIRSDTLFWSPTINSCGSFVSTEIFYSATFDGPYSIIATIPDENTTSYHHSVSGNAYYFLKSNHDCPGLISTPSDTLDNLALAVTTLEKVTVTEDGVLISWYDNGDAKTVGYIIYRSTAQGTIPIDTVFGTGTLEYLDPTAMAEARSESYYVLAIDQCGNTGLFDLPHNTIHLQTEVDYCGQFIKLNWNPYGIWPNGNETVEIWLGIDGDPLAFEHRVQPTDTLAYLTGIEDNRAYCVAIKYQEKGTNVISTSNTVCETTDVINPLTKLLIRNVSVNPDGRIEVLWDHNANADLKILDMNRGNRQNDLQSLTDLNDSRTADDRVVFIDLNANAVDEVYYYQVSAADDCDSTSQSNVMASIVLNAEAKSATQTQLDWTRFDATGRTSLETRLCRIEEDGTERLLFSGQDDSRQFLDMLERPATGTLCYVVKVLHTNSDGIDTLVATSNRVCVLPKVGVFIPNAFVPAGTNQVFRPEFANLGAISEFNMQVFNRWGGLLFESTIPELGWDGTQDGNELQPGVYLYCIKVTQVDGKSEILSGAITLLR